MKKSKAITLFRYGSWVTAVLILALVSVMTGSAAILAQEEAVVFISPDIQEIPVGEEAEIEIRVSNVEDLYGLEFHISFNTEILEVTDADPNTDGIQINPGDFLVSGLSDNGTCLNQVDNNQGMINFAMTLVSGEQPVSGSGLLATIGIRCTGPGTDEITFENPLYGQAPIKLADGSGKPITVTWENGLVESSVNVGDANGDGNVNVLDMTKVARIILQMDSSTSGADCNQDGDVNVLDMTCIARKILGLD